MPSPKCRLWGGGVAKKRRKQRTTRWHFRVNYLAGNYIRVGRVYNEAGYPADIIRYQIKSSEPSGDVDYACTVDEALLLANGLIEAVGREMATRTEEIRKLFHA